MHLVQLLLPLYGEDGTPRPRALFDDVARELVERFGGLTRYHRAPARGVWKADDGREEKDEIVVYEVMVERLDRAWWRAYREGLEARFAQESVVVRATRVRTL